MKFRTMSIIFFQIIILSLSFTVSTHAQYSYIEGIETSNLNNTIITNTTRNYQSGIVIQSTQNDASSGKDAGNNFSDAFEILFGEYSGYLDKELNDTEDYYKVEVNETTPTQLKINSTSPAEVDFELRLYRPDESLAIESTKPKGETENILFRVDQTGYWRINIDFYSGVRGNYTFSVYTVEGNVQDDAGSGKDAGNGPSTALSVSTGVHAGVINRTDGDPYDFFAFNAVKLTDIIHIQLEYNSSQYLDLELYRPDGSFADEGPFQLEQNITLKHLADQNGFWKIGVTSYRDNTQGSYNISISIDVASSQDDATSGIDAGNSYTTALSVSPGWYSGKFVASEGDKKDFFEFEVLTPGSTIEITFIKTTGGNIREYYIRDPSGLTYSGFTYSTYSSKTEIRRTDVEPGNWTLGLGFGGSSGTYELILAVIDPDSQDDAGLSSDASGMISEAMNITTGSHSGDLDPASGDYIDFYSIYVPDEKYFVNATLTPQTGYDYNMYLYSPYGGLENASDATGDSIEHILHPTEEWYSDYTGQWNISVVQNDLSITSAGSYMIEIYIIEYTPPILTNPNPPSNNDNNSEKNDITYRSMVLILTIPLMAIYRKKSSPTN